MKRIAACDGVLRLLVGSNDGCTRRKDIEQLLAVAGPPRNKRQIGVLNFSNAYFHPKTLHILRKDGSEAAYAGSANLTGNGVTSLNIEAGILLDTRDNDDTTVLSQIKQAIDWWFAAQRHGLNLVSKSADLDELVKRGVLDVPPPAPPPGAASIKSTPAQTAVLQALLKLPILPPPAAGSPPSASPGTMAGNQPAQWVKKLSPSDAQRKPTGNQRGGITLVKAGHPIEPSTYFRYDFFNSQPWTTSNPTGSKKREHCVVPFKVDFLGKDLGTLPIEISYEKGRESGQSNYTSELHLGPVLAQEFKSHNVTGNWLRLARSAAGEYSLAVHATAPP